MKTSNKIINFSGMDFRQESKPSMRLRRKPRVAQGQRGRLANNMRDIFDYLRGY